MKNRVKYLAAYLPWLFILLAFDAFTIILLWLSDIRIFKALIVFIILATLVIFSITSILLIKKEEKKISSYKAFLAHPDKNTEI